MFQKNASQVYDSGCEVEEGMWLSTTYLYLFLQFALFEVEIVLALTLVFVFIRPDEAW
jgi:NADH:ubiquinone oxidoreductase subunit 3 (subunit A)